MKYLLQSIRMLMVLTVVTGVIYPLVVTGIAHIAFPKQANGSLVYRGDKVIGSELLAQPFTEARYFWPRPSAADFATVPSGASNKGPTSEDLRKVIAARREKLSADAPADLLTSSGSGLDPHLSPAGIRYQIARVAKARGRDMKAIEQVVDRYTEPPQFGVFGEPRVNVLALNLALDALR